MTRILLVAAVFMLGAVAEAQNVPTLAVKVTELGTMTDTTPKLSLSPTEASLSPRGTLIAFSTDNSLRLWNAKTNTNTLLVNGFAESPTWSPSGDVLAFARQADKGSDETIWALRVDPSTGAIVEAPWRVSISKTTGNSPAFSPDGRTIAFIREDSAKQTSLLTVPVRGGPERVLVSGVFIRRVRWSPDASELFYMTLSDQTGTRAALSRVPSAGGTARVIHEFSIGAGGPPVIMADGRTVFRYVARTGDANIGGIEDFMGNPLATVTFPGSSWLADYSGKHLLAGVRESHPRALRVVNIDDGKVRELIGGLGTQVGAPAWSNDGRVATVALENGKSVLILMNADGSIQKKIALKVQPNFNSELVANNNDDLQVSPDAHFATYASLLHRSLELVDLTSGAQRTLATSDAVNARIWTHDSKSVRYVRIEQGHPRSIHEVSLAGGDRLIREVPPPQFNRAVTFIDENTAEGFGDGTTLMIPLASGPTRVVVRGPVNGAGAVSWDARWLAERRNAPKSTEPVQRISLISLVDSTEKVVELPFIATGGFWSMLQFAPDNQHLLLAGRDRENGPLNVYSQPINGGAPRIVASADTRAPGLMYAISPDGHHLLYVVDATPSITFLSFDYTAIDRLPKSRP